jgi:hypothetical protein
VAADQRNGLKKHPRAEFGFQHWVHIPARLGQPRLVLQAYAARGGVRGPLKSIMRVIVGRPVTERKAAIKLIGALNGAPVE